MNSDEKRLGAGMIASVFLNGLLIIPITASVVSPRSQEATAAQAAQAPDFEPPPPPPDEVKLGIEESDASTLTWVGYEQYLEHMARLADVEQAQFTISGAADGGGGQPEPPAQQQPESVPQQVPVEQPTDATPTEQPAPPAVAPAPVEAPLQPDSEAPVTTEQPQPTEIPSPTPKPTPTPQPNPNKDAEPQPETPAAKPVEKTSPQPPKPPTPAQPTQPTPNGGDAAPQPGPPSDTPGPQAVGADDRPPNPDASDRESDATATVELAIKRLGRPVAAQGLRVRTHRPRLTAFQELQFRQIALVAKIDFDSRGKPRRVFIGKPDPRPGHTGRMRWFPGPAGLTKIEEIVQTSLFRWSATGKSLKELGPDDTVPIIFRLTYN